jgi:very-short-patch-repair endonuclease
MSFFCDKIKEDTSFDVEKEYKFHTSRKWRMDYAIVELKICIEIDGGVWINGRHNRGAGYIKDMEKLNNAAMLGWVVLRFTPEQKFEYKTFEIIKNTIRYKLINQ